MTTEAIKKAETELENITVYLNREAVEGLIKVKFPTLVEGKKFESFSVHYYPDCEDIFIKGYYSKEQRESKK